LPYEEPGARSAHVELASLGIDQVILSLEHSRLALVVEPHDLAADLKSPAFGSGRQRLKELYVPLAVDDALAVELRRAGDALSCWALSGVEVDDLGAGVLEGEDDGVGGEDGEVRVEFLLVYECHVPGSWGCGRAYIEKVQLVYGASYAIREQ